MTTTSSTRKKRKTILDLNFLHPDRVLDLAYSLYVSQLPLKESGVTGRHAREVIKDFFKLYHETDKNTSEGIFLFSISQVIISLSRGIARGKALHEESKNRAHEEKEQRIRDLSSTAQQNGFSRGSLRALLVGGLGFTLINAFFPSLEIDSANPTYTGLAVGIALVLGSTYVQSWLLNYKVVQIFACHEHDLMHAYRRYRIELRNEYLRAKDGAIQAWREYTGEEPPSFPAFEDILEEELRLEESYQEGRYELRANPFVKLFEALSPRQMIVDFLPDFSFKRKKGEQV